MIAAVGLASREGGLAALRIKARPSDAIERAVPAPQVEIIVAARRAAAAGSLAGSPAT